MTAAIHCAYDSLVRLGELREHPRNPNRHPQSQIDLLAQIITRTGWRHPITVSNLSGCIVAGHGRLYAARAAGLSEAPVDYQDFASTDEELEHLLADNRLAELSAKDDEAVAAILRDLQQAQADLSLTGYDHEQVSKLLARLDPALPPDEPPAPQVSELEELRQRYGVGPGQVWQLGEHRLAVADAADAEMWERVMEGAAAHLVFTDPPYGVSYEDSAGRSIANDNLRQDDLSLFITRVFQNCIRRTIPEAAFYVWHASCTRDDFAWALRSLGLVERQYLTWVKEAFVLGRAHYHWQTEHCFYMEKSGSSARWFGDRKQASVWTISPAARGLQGVTVGREGVHISDGEGASLLVKCTRPPRSSSKVRHFRVPLADALVLLPESAGSAWRISRDPAGDYVHPNQKPATLAARALINSTQEGEMVLDPFAGSGSTLLACQTLGRTCRAFEIDPRYAAAVIHRWAQTSGGSPALLGA